AETRVKRVERERVRDVLRRHEPRNERARGADTEGRERGRREGKDVARPHLRMWNRRVDDKAGDGRGRAGFTDDEQPPPVERVRSGAADEREREDRNELDERDRADGERRSSQLVDLVRERDVRDL